MGGFETHLCEIVPLKDQLNLEDKLIRTAADEGMKTIWNLGTSGCALD